MNGSNPIEVHLYSTLFHVLPLANSNRLSELNVSALEQTSEISEYTHTHIYIYIY